MTSSLELHELHDDVRVCMDITRYLRVYNIIDNRVVTYVVYNIYDNIHGVCQCGGGLGIEARYSLIGHSFTRGLREDDTSLSSGHQSQRL